MGLVWPNKPNNSSAVADKLNVFDHFVRLAFKELNIKMILERKNLQNDVTYNWTTYIYNSMIILILACLLLEMKWVNAPSYEQLLLLV